MDSSSKFSIDFDDDESNNSSNLFQLLPQLINGLNIDEDGDFDDESINNDEFDDDSLHQANTVTQKQAQQAYFNDSASIIGTQFNRCTSSHVSELIFKEKLSDSDVDINLFECESNKIAKYFKDFLFKYAFTEQTADKTSISLNSRQLKLSKALQRKLGSFFQMLKKFDPKRQLNENDLNDQVKLFTYLEEYKRKIIRSLRSLVERVCCDTVIPEMNCGTSSNISATNKGGGGGGALSSMNSQQNQTSSVTNTNPTSKLWAEIRARGCQFLGPEMQDDVLRLIIHFLNIVTRISRKGLVSWIVLKLKNTYSKASRTSVGHVVSFIS